MKMKRMILLMLLLLALSTAGMKAQVVSGSSTQPINAGAILDLSKFGDGPNTNLGLLLPNVSLTSDTMPLVTGIANIEGMLVYCPGGTGNLPKGLYVWNGDNWKVAILV
jgi:hypothetical protein